MNEVTRNEQTRQPAQNDGSKGGHAAVRPPVDVREDAAGMTLIVDLPGVSRDGLGLQVEGNTLLIEGRADLDLVEGLQSVYAESRARHYRRSFTLSDELDSENIDAKLDAGVLTLRVPKHETAQPRRIEVQVH